MSRDSIASNPAARTSIAPELLRGLLLCSAVTPVAAFAQQATVSDDTAPLQEIVVTAQRRAESLQDVPISITAITAERAAAQGINNTLALTAVAPSLQINQTSNFGTIYMRGVGSNLADPTAEPSVATYIDGVYISSPQTNFFSFNNIERVEILKGPQGTLFGRNATGGVIQVVTRNPSHVPSADVSIGYGNYNTLSSSLYGTTGITDDLAADLAVVYESREDGFGRNVTLDKDIYRSNNLGVRSKWLWTPAEGTSVQLTGDFSRMFHNNAYQYRQGVISPSYGVDLYAGAYNATGNLETRVSTKSWGGALRVDQDVGPLQFVSITSVRRSTPDFDLDSDQGPLTLGGSIYSSYVRNASQEFQLMNKSDGDFDWVVGLFYFDLTGGYDPWNSIGGQFLWRAEQTTESWAGYGQATRRFDTGTSITAGARYTKEDQDMWSVNLGNAATAFSNAMSHEKTTWRFAVDQELGDNVLAYVSYNRGYKSGGYNLLDSGSLNRPPPHIVPSYNPEIVDSYEAGIKSDILDRRLRLNVSAFYYDYQDIQLQQPVQTGNRIMNAASATVKGLETEFELSVTSGLTLTGGLSLLDSKYKDFFPAPAVSATGIASVVDATGNELVSAPKKSGSLGAEYQTDIAGRQLTAAVNAVYNDGFFWHPDNRLRQPSYTVLNGSITLDLAGDRHQVRLWGKNLNDERYYVSEAEVQGRGDWEMPAPPRTYGITFLSHFE